MGGGKQTTNVSSIVVCEAHIKLLLRTITAVAQRLPNELFGRDNEQVVFFADEFNVVSSRDRAGTEIVWGTGYKA